jgi:hypothetical protein
MEKTTGRIIGATILVIAIFVVGAIWQPDDQAEGQIASQEGWTQTASQRPVAPASEQAPQENWAS